MFPRKGMTWLQCLTGKQCNNFVKKWGITFDILDAVFLNTSDHPQVQEVQELDLKWTSTIWLFNIAMENPL